MKEEYVEYELVKSESFDEEKVKEEPLVAFKKKKNEKRKMKKEKKKKEKKMVLKASKCLKCESARNKESSSNNYTDWSDPDKGRGQ